MKYKTYLNESVDELIDILTDWVIIDYNNSLLEIFDTKHKIQVVINTDTLYQTKFDVESVKYRFHAMRFNDNGWGIQFFPTANIYHGNLGGSSYIGSVFSAVFQSLRMLINDKNVDMFVFTAADKDLERLYRKMILWIHKRFPKYQIDKKYLNKNEFVFKKVET